MSESSERDRRRPDIGAQCNNLYWQYPKGSKNCYNSRLVHYRVLTLRPAELVRTMRNWEKRNWEFHLWGAGLVLFVVGVVLATWYSAHGT
jgi:hypothetical protein